MSHRFVSPLVAGLAFLLLGAQAGTPPASEAPVTVPADPIGTIEGTFSVDASGAATYEVPLEVPPGTQGTAPQLGLTYNSQRDNGMVGMGWALNGIENVARCNATEIPNGYTAAVTYTYRDRFCMAGMPLVAVAGEYGYDGTEYRTSRDTWTRIVSRGACGQGPCYFTAQNKDGAELRFGFTTGATGSRVLASGRTDGAVRVWSQDRYTDLNGNYVALVYRNNSALGEYYPVRIDYSGNDRTGAVPQRAVTFDYETRSDRITGYTGGSPYQILSRMTAIKTWVDTSLVKSYFVGYAIGSTTGRSQVTSLRECSSAAPADQTCLPATTFALSNPGNGLSAGPVKSTGQSTSSQLGLLSMDVNGDGKTDFVDAWQASNQLNLTTYLSTGRDLGNGSSQNTNTGAGKLGILGMDVNGDRRGDVVMPVELSGSLSLYAFLSTGSGFGGSLQTPTGKPSKALSYLPMDVSGDGLEDVVQAIDSGGKVGFVVFPASGTGTFGAAVTSSTAIATTNDGFFPIDANGDGRIDVVQVQKSGGAVQLITYLSDGRAFDGGATTSTGRNPGKFEVDAGDVNGDGLGDLLLLEDDGSKVEVTPFLSTGTTFRNVRSTILEGGSKNLGIASASLNGDDRSDLLQRLDRSGKVTYQPFYGNGETFAAGPAFASSIGKESLGQRLLDLDGDGKQDVLEPQEASGKVQLSLVLNTVGQPDLLGRTVNGLAGEVIVTHLPMTDGRIYNLGSGATYPVADIATSLPLVAAYSNLDGRGARYDFSYSYDQARVGYSGRGWLGFRAIRMIQDSNGRFSEVTYSQDYPRQGLVTRNSIHNRDQVMLASTDLAYEDASSAALQAKGIHQFVRTSETYSAYADNHGGARLYTLQKTYGYDSRANINLISDLGQPAVTTDDRFTCFRYQDDAARWRLGYLLQELVAKTADRCRSFIAAANPSWDPATDVNWQKRAYDDRMNQNESAVWDDSNNVWVSATATFDDYGNQLTATDPARNTTTFEYDATYHTFLAKLTSPPNEQGTALVDTFGYEPFFGNQVRNLDPNGNLFTWSVDALGRVVDEYGPIPGGSPTSPVRLRHTGFGRNNSGFYAQVSSRPAWDAGDDPATWFWERTYSDGLEREWRSETRGASDATATVNELRFNAEGQTSHTSLPYFANTSPSFVVTTYDVYNRPVTVTQPDGTVQKFDYSQLGSLKVYVTDAFGTPEARTEIDQFDAYGQLTSQILSNGEVYKYQYNLLSELLQIDTLPDRRQVKFVYDSLGRLRETTTTDTGTTRYDWNAVNRMTGTRDADGNTVAYTYDALGRILNTTGTTAGGSSLVRLTYDGPTSNGKGNVTRAELSRAPLGDYRYELGYDPYKQTRSVRVALAGGNYSYGLDWNPLGQLAGETYPDGSRLTVAYRADANPLTFALASGGPAETLISYDGYDASDVPLRTVYKNGVETTRSFYPDDVATGKVKTIVASRAGSTLFGNEYSWNRLDFVTGVKDLVASRGNETYTYDKDKLGFLTGAQGPYGSEAYTYDKVGNRKSHNGVAYTYPAGSDRLSNYGPGTDLQWNANGSLKKLVNASGSFDFTYDAGGRVTGVAKAGVGQAGVLAYDFVGNRVYYQPIGSNTKVYGIAADYEIADYGNGKILATKYIEGQYGRAAAITRPLASLTAAAAPVHHHRMAARLYQGGSGLAGALLPAWHSALALVSAPAFVEAAAFAVPALFALAGLAGSVLLAARQRRVATPYARRQPLFAAAVPLVAALFMILTTSPLEAALSPGANGAGNPTEGTLYFVQDLVQSNVLVTNEQGATSATVGYLPFGAVDPAASQGIDNFRPKFTDKTFDTDQGLYFFGERYYDPAVGRFTTPDPVAQYLNPYVLGADNPISQIDPNGEFAFLAVIIIGAVIGAYMGAAAVNHDYNPANWDWKSGKTYAGLLGGAIIGAVGGVIVEVAATAGVAAGIVGAVLVGAGENAAFTAMGGGSAKDILISAAEGAAFGFLFGGAGAALGRLFRGASGAAADAGRAGRAARAGAELVEGASEATESAVARGLRSSCSSFLPGEEVLTADGGRRAIETLGVGDRVIGYQQEKDASGAFPVAAKLSGESASITEIVTASGARIAATPNHPFRVADMGWLPASELHVGLALVNPEGRPVALRSVEQRELPAPRAVYNVSVDQAESYYVSADRVLVKNVHGACLLAKGKRRPGWRRTVKDGVFKRQTIASGAGKGQIESAVSKTRYARSQRVAVGTKGRKVTIWQLDHAKAPYRDLLWAAGKSKRVITWRNMIDISNYSPNLRYLTMAENVSHAFEPTTAQGRKAAVQILKNLKLW